MSPLSLCSKISEKLIFDSIFSFMTHNKLLNNCQSGFRPNDSCINQLISITHNIYRAFDANPSFEVQAVFLHLSKTFNKVWHEGLSYSLKNNGINGNALQLIESFLHNKCQEVVLNGQSSSWPSKRAGSVLGPLFFLIYINALPEGLTSKVKLFDDDSSLFSIINCVSTSASALNSDLLKIMDWPYQWKMSFKSDRTKQAKKKEKILQKEKRNYTSTTLFQQFWNSSWFKSEASGAYSR